MKQFGEGDQPPPRFSDGLVPKHDKEVRLDSLQSQGGGVGDVVSHDIGGLSSEFDNTPRGINGPINPEQPGGDSNTSQTLPIEGAAQTTLMEGPIKSCVDQGVLNLKLLLGHRLIFTLEDLTPMGFQCPFRVLML